MKMKTHNPKPVRHCKNSAKGKVHSNTGIPQETIKKSNKKANYRPEATRKGEMKNPRVRRRRYLKNYGRNKCKRNKRDHSKNQQSQKLVF